MKATIYTTSDFFGNLVKYEVTLLKAEIKPYAQYQESIQLAFIPKGKRKPMRLIKSYNPFVFVVAGHGFPEPENMMQVIKKTTDCTISQSKYASFDERYEQEASIFVEAIANNCKILVDFRHVKNTKIINHENFS